MIDYIHHNPVRRDLCEHATDWEWSSARWYAGMRSVRFQIDATLPMMYDS
jgi:putative transposase